MYFHSIESDQLSTCSNRNGKRADCHLEKPPSSATAPVPSAQDDPSRLADRALQTLWQAGLQMRRGSRPRPQVLSVGESFGLAATDGLCAAGISRPGCRIRRQLSPSPRNPGSDLRDQPRTATPPRGALKAYHERGALRPLSTNRCWIGWRAPRQYGGGVVGWELGRCDKWGGRQETQKSWNNTGAARPTSTSASPRRVR